LADTLSCYTPSDERFVSALNQLIKEGLILGIEVPNEHRVAIALNPNKINEIEKAIRNWYENPNFWITTLIVAIGSLIVAIWQIFLK
jgi:hypothetical protein